jgi:hypothetical protein
MAIQVCTNSGVALAAVTVDDDPRIAVRGVDHHALAVALQGADELGLGPEGVHLKTFDAQVGALAPEGKKALFKNKKWFQVTINNRK